MTLLLALFLALATGLADPAALWQRGRRREAAVALGLVVLGLAAALVWSPGSAAPTIGAVLRWLVSPMTGQQ